MVDNDFEREAAEFEAKGAAAADAIANACTNCGNVGWTIEHNDEEEYMAGCHECWVAALDAEQEGAS